MNAGNRTSLRTSLRVGKLLALFVFGVGAFLSTGCDKKEGASNGVTGKVTLDNKPVSGNVIFIGSDNKEYPPALINAEGKYTITDLPAGDYKVVVRSMGAPAGGLKTGPGMKDTGAGGAGSGATAPEKYGNAATSGLTFKRTTGKQENDIVLAP